jgi:hypothetical protein
VPPIRIEASHFSPDTCLFIELLHTHGVRYLIVGGEAVILHGHVRLTGDVDFFFSNDQDNIVRVFSVLDEFWDGDVPGLEGPEDLSLAWTVVQFGLPPNRIDLINSIDGIEFAEAWPGRVEAVLVTTDGDVPLLFIGLEELARNKRATGRPKDLDDLSYLIVDR